MATVTIGQVIHSYTVLRKLGEGGMGAVFEVVHSTLGKPAALKVLSADLQRHPTLVARFSNEAKILAKLDHPAIVKVVDFGQLADGTLFYIMEYLKGQSLAQFIDTCRPRGGLGMEYAPFLAELASGLAAAHKLGIIHRDMKPANVMVVDNPLSSLGVSVKLLDFGIAKLPEDPRTGTGVHLGTPVYMAPEQIRDPSRVDSQADLYSLGVIAYELLSGQLPYEQRETMAVLLAKTIDPPRPLAQFAPNLPPALLSLVMRLLAKEPQQRGTVLEFEMELRQILGIPLSRQSGMHDALEAPDPTADVSPAAISGIQSIPPTPSEQRAVGEISPPKMAVPQSLSSMPSLPVQAAPPLRAAPEHRTTAGAPIQLQAAALATPSSPTKPDATPRRTFYLVGAIVVMGALATVAVEWWPRQPSKQPTVATERPPPVVATSPIAVVSPPTAPTPSGSTNIPVSGAIDTAPAENKAPAQALPIQASKPPREPQFPTDSCIQTEMSKPQRSRLLSAFKTSGAKFRPGERLVISGFPHYPQITTAPASLNADSAEAYELTGLLRNADLPSQVELKCRAK